MPHEPKAVFPTISVVIPTLNCAKTLGRCLTSLFQQKYPINNIELIIVDAFSRDQTLKIAEQFKAKILFNPQITFNVGKAIGTEVANGELILFIDSDNVIPSKDWLIRMIEPLIKDQEIVGSEPVYYAYNSKDPIIIRYCSLIGADDPLTVYLGFYGRYSYLKGRWTDAQVKFVDSGAYYKVTLSDKDIIPTMGANGFLVRALALKRTNFKPYLFDIDIIYDLLSLGYSNFARVKVAMSHLYAFNLMHYLKKTYRHIRDYYHYHKLGVRKYPWTRFDRLKLLKFVLSAILIYPLVKDSVKGYKQKPDIAWFLHWLICFLTVLVYATKEASSGFCMLRKRFYIYNEL